MAVEGTRKADHAETHSLVIIYEVAKVFTSSRYRYAFAVTKLVQSTMDTEICLPILAISFGKMSL
jgi:hypothetical protein